MKQKIILLLLLLPAVTAKAQDDSLLQAKIEEVIAPYDAKIGVAVIVNGLETTTVNNTADYPLMSVMKFHQALAVANFLQHEDGQITDKLYITPEQLLPDTWSPLRDQYPGGGVRVSIGDLLRYTLQQSDNNACDILFNLIGGPRYVNRYIRSLGLRQTVITATEAEMHASEKACYANRTSPLDAARLLERFETRMLFSHDVQSLIRRLMITCQTGMDRLPLPLMETKAVIGHKTGTSDLNSRQRWTGTNDIGFVRLPSGQRYVIAVFVKDSAEAPVTNARIIADISRTVFEHVTRQTEKSGRRHRKP